MLLLPAFFAYAFQSRRELTARTFIFYLGLATIFVPLGMGASLASFLFLDHRDTMIRVAGALLIAFGILELAGRSLSFLNLSGGGTDATGSLFGTYSLGMVYGFGGFCSGPILGSVLTVAATDSNPAHGGLLLAVYALGTVVPLLILALLWDRLSMGEWSWLRGFGVKAGPLHLHSTNLIAGTLFIALGLSFIFLDGTNALSTVYADLGLEEASFEADVWVKDATSWIPDQGLLAVGALVTAVVAYRFVRWVRLGDESDDSPAGASSAGAAGSEIDLAADSAGLSTEPFPAPQVVNLTLHHAGDFTMLSNGHQLEIAMKSHLRETLALLRIGEAARDSGVAVRTIRFYEGRGLITPASRSPGGYRLFTPKTVARLRFISRARRLGLSLTQIGAVLDAWDKDGLACPQVADTLRDQLREIDRQIVRLTKLRDDLWNLAARIAREGRPGDDCVCPALEEHADA